jgi:hypothetical protein
MISLPFTPAHCLILLTTPVHAIARCRLGEKLGNLLGRQALTVFNGGEAI